MTDDEELERLVVRVVAGDDTAWQALWAAIEAPLSRIIAQPRFLGRLGQAEDDRRNIVVAVMARLSADSFVRLRQYLDARVTNPRLRFLSWLRVVAKRVGIDYMRAHPDYLRRYDPDASQPGAWVEAGQLPPASQLAGERPPVTKRGTAQQLLAYAAKLVSEDQQHALWMWTQSESFEDIARTLALPSPGDAERLVRSVLERLRRQFREAQGAR